jgi:hypothetical protein
MTSSSSRKLAWSRSGSTFVDIPVDTYHEAKYTLDNLQDGFAQGKAGLADE